MFGLEVKARREEQKWSMTEFANLLKQAGLENFHPTTVSRMESGQRPVRLSEAVIIAHVLGDTLDNLVVEPLTGDEDIREHMQYMSHASMMAGRWIHGVSSRRKELEDVIHAAETALAEGKILPEHVDEVRASLVDAAALLERKDLVDEWTARFESMTTEEFQAGARGESWTLEASEGAESGEHSEEG